MQVYAKNDSKITLRQFDIKTNNVFGLKHAGNDSGPPPIEAMLTRFDPDQIKYNKHFDNIFYIGYLKR